MRKYTPLLICLITGFLLSSCAKNTMNDVELPISPPKDSQQTQQQEQTHQPVEQMPLATISMPIKTVIEKAPDGTELFQYAYQDDISIHLPDANAAHKIKLDILNRIDSSTDDAEELSASAAQNYTKTGWSPYLYQIIFQPERIDYNVVSLSGRTTIYRGGSHPETTYTSVTYDAVSGDVLHLSDILVDSASSEKIAQLIVDSLNEQSQLISLYEGFERTVSERFNANFRQDTRWYLSTDGLCVYFSPYEIAPYASGLVVAQIPYEKLTGILNDAYFPPEQQTAGGILSAQLFTEEVLNQFDQFAEIVLNPDGDMILLYTNQYVQDLRIKINIASSDYLYDTPQQTIFAAYGLTAKDAIMLETILKDAQSDLQITYKANDQTYEHYITGTPGTSVNLQ